MPEPARPEQPSRTDNEISIDPLPMPDPAEPRSAATDLETGEEAAIGVGELQESEALLVAGLDAAGPEPPTATPDLIPENDLTPAAAPVDETDNDLLPLPTPVADIGADAEIVTAEAIEPSDIVAELTEMAEMKITEAEGMTVERIEVSIDIADAELGRAAALTEEAVEPRVAVEEDADEGELHT